VEPPVEAFAPRARPTLVPPALRAPVLQAAPVPPPPPPPPPQDARGGMEALLDYWVGLRRGHGVPPLANLDRGLVADRWRDCFLVTYGPMGAAAPKIARLSTPTGEIQYSPMVTEWIITTAKEAARHGEAMEDEQDFPHGSGAAGYRMLLLPFTTADGRSECVLCHLSRAPRQRARA